MVTMVSGQSGWFQSVLCFAVLRHLSHVQLYTTRWILAHQATLSMEFSRQEYWSGWPFPYPGDLLTQGLNSGLPRCGQILYHLSYQGSPVPIMVPLIFHLLVDTLNSQSHLPRMPTSLELREVLIFSKWAKEYT